MNIGRKLPNTPSLVLTTCKELNRVERVNCKSIILAYSDTQKFENYLLEVLSSYRVGYKEIYSSLTFSIDPGEKIGLMIFLDDYFLDSYCCFKEVALIDILEEYIPYFVDKNENLQLNFKFGIGVISVTYNLVKLIFSNYKNRKFIRIFLIDEYKSSKIKIGNKRTTKFTKDEIAALIISLREGVEVNLVNYENFFNHIKTKRLKIERWKDLKFEKNNSLSLEIIAKRVLNGELSLMESIKIIKEHSSYLSKNKN
ncbi:MAG: hypothetical protein ACFE8M_00955 [Candidatus Hermodarchaeota archaeon]